MSELMLSVVIPAHNEEGCIGETVQGLSVTLKAERIRHEIIVVNDNSRDQTESILKSFQLTIPELRVVNNDPPNGFGFAIRKGLDEYKGDAVAIFMADLSDSPNDLVKFFRLMESTGVDCVFGSRFIRGGYTLDYPWPKRILNRLANQFIQALFGLRYNDVTNAFKLYRRPVIDGMRPFLSHHFNLTVELPLKSIIRGYKFLIVPNSWTNRKTGESKLKIKEMGSRYLFIVLYCFIEKWLSRGDYKMKQDSKLCQA